MTVARHVIMGRRIKAENEGGWEYQLFTAYLILKIPLFLETAR
jgi:hypothetical protein